MYSGYHSWSHIDALALRPDIPQSPWAARKSSWRSVGVDVLFLCAVFARHLLARLLPGFRLLCEHSRIYNGRRSRASTLGALWWLQCWHLRSWSWRRWHHWPSSHHRRLLTRKRSSRRTSTRWIRHQRLDPFHCKSTDEMSHQDGHLEMRTTRYGATSTSWSSGTASAMWRTSWLDLW